MSDRILQLGVDDLWRVLELIDPVELVAAELSGQATDCEAREFCRLVPAPDMAAADEVPASEPVLLDDVRTDLRCLLPASSLFDLRTAALVGLAARELLAPGVVTAAFLGSGTAVQLQLAVVARHVPGISFMAVWPNDENVVPVEMRVLDLLERAGIGLLIAEDPGEAMFGANLLVSACQRHDHLRANQLALGAVLVNTTGRDLPDQVVDGVDEVFVDDVELLAGNRHRRFVQQHLDQPGFPEPLRRPEGWHRRPGPRRVSGGLRQVLTGAHPGRTFVDDVLLVELLGIRELDVTLAYRLRCVAQENGIGVWLFE